MKRITAFIFAVFMIFCSSSAFYAGSASYNFYCKRNSNHQMPELDPQFEFISDYDAYYVDQNAKDEKIIYLTFDAGYDNGNVSRIVDVLDAHGVKGSFFILENLIKRNPGLVKKMSDGGHLVCNHTARHKDMTKFNDKNSFAEELHRLEKAYKELTGIDMAKIYRPPEGRFSEENLKFAKELGYKTVFWSFAYADWDNNSQPSPEKALEKILSNIHCGEIMLHPTSATNAQIMDSLLDALEREGYRFATLTELWKS